MIVGWGAYVSHRQKYREVDPLVARKGKLYIVGYCQRCLDKRGEQNYSNDDDYHFCIGGKNCTGCSLSSPRDSDSPVVQKNRRNRNRRGNNESRQNRISKKLRDLFPGVCSETKRVQKLDDQENERARKKTCQ